MQNFEGGAGDCPRPADDNTHAGHRARLRNRFLRDGLDNFEMHNVMELLLFYSLPRRDTNEIAHALCKKFGSIAAIMDAPYEELISVKGISENTAVLIKLIPALCRRYLESRETAGDIITSTEQAGAYLVPKFIGRTDEIVVLMCMDSKRKVLNTSIVNEGNVNATQVNIRKLVHRVLNMDATSAILAHNHPGGLALPSKEDLATTRLVADALEAVNIELLDHIIVADNDFVSLRDSGFFAK